MNIIVNATPLLAPITGIGQYIRQLFSAMSNIAGADVQMFYGTRCETGVRLPAAGKIEAMQRSYGLLRRFIPRPRAMRRLLEKAFFTYHAHNTFNGALYHEPNFIPLPYTGPVVLTVQDLSCFDHPEMHPEERVRLMQRDMPAAIEKADHIIVISEATGAALRRWFNVDPTRITKTHLAADLSFLPRSTAMLAPALVNLGLIPGSYVLSVGTLEPRKNLGTLFAAYAGLPAALRQRYPLAVAGMTGWKTEGLMKSAEKLIRRGELRLLGYVADELVPPLYAGAAAFVYPSRYEGFGLPALEAMACGVPVITGNLTSLPEVVGDAGIMVDPDDVNGMRESLLRLLEDRAYAEDLGRRGLVRAGTFSWERCARETFSVYEKVMKQRGNS